MRHPAPAQIALFAGGDLGRWERWRVLRHVARCSSCRHQLQAHRDVLGQFRERTAELADLPPDLQKGLHWNQLAEEMTGNIRVGLAAGEAIALFDKPLRARPRVAWLGLSWNAAWVAAAALAIFGIAFWTSLPSPQADHLLTSLRRIRTERIGALIHSVNPVAGSAAEEVVLEASSSSIQVRENGRAMSLMPRSEGATVSVSMPGSAGVRFVDADTGQVTTNKVYYAEQ
jgi:hypothetical protein